MEYSVTKEGNSDICYNTNELWKIVSAISQTPKETV
jgi:hypothetical protein